MQLEYADKKLQRLEQDFSYTAGFEGAIVRMFRKRIQFIRSAVDERDLRSMKSLHFEKLKGKSKDLYSIRLNRQWRLVMWLKKQSDGTTVVIIEVVDYH